MGYGCTIVLDNPENKYFPGQLLKGTVNYEFDNPKRIRGIKIEFLGLAETDWSSSEETTNSDGKTEEVNKIHSGREEYIKKQYYLIGSEGGIDIVVPPGRHSYPFSYILPSVLPSSYEAEFGHIRYFVKTILDRPWKSNRENVLTFTVAEHFDLDNDTKYKTPLNIHMKKSFCCCCCKSVPLLLDVSFPASAFCSRQLVPVEISWENGTNISGESITFKIIKIFTYRCEIPYKKEKVTTDKILIKEVDGFPANSTSHRTEHLQMPQVTVSNLENCTIMDIKYQLVVTLRSSGWHWDKEKSSNIVLGALPWKDSQIPTGYGNMNDDDEISKFASAPLETPPLNMSQPTYPVPSYSPAHFNNPVSSGCLPYPSSTGNVPYPSSTGNVPYPPYPVSNNPMFPATFNSQSATLGWAPFVGTGSAPYPVNSTPSNPAFSPYPVTGDNSGH